MSGAQASVTVKLYDQLTAPAQIIRNSLRGIVGDMKALSGARLGITKQIEAASKRASELRSNLLKLTTTSALAGYGLYRAVKPGKEFETLLLDIAQKADLSDSAMKALGERIKGIAPTVNRSAQEVGKGVDFLLGMGLDVEKALAITPQIGKTATAYRAEVEDLSKASFAAIDNLKLPVDQLGKALDVMAQAGKEGAFELKDMAREFPSLTASAEALGLKGVGGIAKLTAALQIARKGAADGSEAATNTANLMQKIISPETTKKFKKVGIDIRKELKKTQDSGGDVFEMIANLTKKATKGDIAKLGDFFEDAQVQKFMRPLIAQLDEYKRIRDKAGAATGVVDEDYNRRIKTFQAAIDRVQAAFEKLGIALGNSLTGYISILLDKVSALATSLESLVTKFPDLTAALVGATAAVGLFAAGLTAIRLGGALADLVGLKSAKGILDYVAPWRKRGALATPEPSFPKPAEAVKPRAMTPKEIAAAQKGMQGVSAPAAGGGAGGLRGFLGKGLRGGAAGIIAGYLGEALIDMIPKPEMSDAQRAKLDAKMNAGIGELFSDLLEDLGHRKESKQIDPAALEKAYRAQKERDRNPEGARGRAMVQDAEGNDVREAVTREHSEAVDREHADRSEAVDRQRSERASTFVPERKRERPVPARDEGEEAREAMRGKALSARELVPQDGKAEGISAGAAIADGILNGLESKSGAVIASVRILISQLRAELASAGLSVNITPKLAGGGVGLRAIYSDTGVE